MHRTKYFIFLLIFFLQYCNPTDPPVDDTKLSLSLEDVSCTEAWIKLTGKPGSNIILTRDDKEIMRFNLISEDTTIMNDSLLPNKSYVYQLLSSNNIVRSNKISVTTMNTTSHDFTWQSWTFGEHSSSYLNDVSIIDENNIWAVGAIYMNDSLGNPDPLTYNAINWDGKKWEPKRISVNFRGNLITPILEGVFAFTDADIWFVGSLPIHGDGINWKMFDLRTTVDPNLTLSKAWGASTDDIYFVGRKGNIAYHQSGKWQKIESGTELNINDIWGEYNNKTGEYEIIAVTSNILESLEKDVIKIDKTETKIIDKTGIGGTLSSLWFKPDRKYYIAGGGIYEKSYLNDIIWRNNPLDITSFYTYKIRGQGLNDLAAAGGAGEVLHYNGLSWKTFFYKTQLNYGNYYSIAIKGNLIIAVGEDISKAAITIGVR